MLSQRITKSLYALDSELASGRDGAAPRAELTSAARLFDDTLRAFDTGGVATGGEGKPVDLKRVESDEGRAKLAQGTVIWHRYQALLAPIIAGNATVEQVHGAVGFARQNNVELLTRMNGITTALESDATRRVATLRSVQVTAIFLALLNFVFIVFQFLRRLAVSDRQAEAASRETHRILTTVQEGLFLIDADHRLGSQMSEAVHAIFGRQVEAGEDFFQLLAPLTEPRVMSDAREYASLLFAPHVRQQLMGDLNPLTGIAFEVLDELGTRQRKYLSFGFRRVEGEDGRTALLVTVQDVTSRIELERDLAASRQQATAELATLVETLSSDRDALSGYLERTENGLLEINRILEEGRVLVKREELSKLLERVARRMHAVHHEALVCVDLEKSG